MWEIWTAASLVVWNVIRLLAPFPHEGPGERDSLAWAPVGEWGEETDDSSDYKRSSAAIKKLFYWSTYAVRRNQWKADRIGHWVPAVSGRTPTEAGLHRWFPRVRSPTPPQKVFRVGQHGRAWGESEWIRQRRWAEEEESSGADRRRETTQSGLRIVVGDVQLHGEIQLTFKSVEALIVT